MEKVLFGYLALAILLSALFAIFSRNVVRSVLWLLVLFLHQSVLFLTLQAEFLAAIQIIVYAGAVLVLFLFVVYLINLREEIRLPKFLGSYPLAFIAVLSMLILAVAGLVGFVPAKTVGSLSPGAILKVGHTQILGEHLFREHILAFEIAGVLLLVAVLGAVVLVRRLREGEL
ncbi:NADH-quinone oxidoreductase subunit J family protein [Thermosulfurimonas dismutans]|uniref:NADH-quinone oxidoreductase subunit J n=1 Tax=Thermosulfurimonas dismutans TaxID=999894 RepID=A0A179D528_9BACT|nr:NADH-quinone oxidoreductase subunit J [Thermosulfurimonas dismutans]OAQ20891.1 NADH-ubiquinone oxidoreductase chain J [Thermosulfurimonas dismutans]